jgi:hypothetical protein
MIEDRMTAYAMLPSMHVLMMMSIIILLQHVCFVPIANDQGVFLVITAVPSSFRRDGRC